MVRLSPRKKERKRLCRAGFFCGWMDRWNRKPPQKMFRWGEVSFEMNGIDFFERERVGEREGEKGIYGA